MIRRLRTRFVIFNMLIVAVLLLAMMFMALRFNRYTLRQRSIDSLQRIAAVPLGKDVSRWVPTEKLPATWFVLTRTEEGLVARGSEHYDLSDPEVLEQILTEAEATGETDGTLPQRSLRYYRSGNTVAFADVSGERQLIRGIREGWFMSLSIIFVCFFLVSLGMSFVMTWPTEKAWKQQRQFIADASHELKTPLSVIMANAELLQSGEENRFAGNILTMSYQMRSLVERMLEMARLDSLKAEKKPLDFSQLVSDAALSVQLLFEEQGRPLKADIPEDIRVRGNEPQLYQLLDVLLDNALKYSEGEGAVEVCLKQQRKLCLLTVTSPGTPLTRQQQKDVFKRFYRADPARSRCGSYGLGLAIAQAIVRSHRGIIRAQGKDGHNTFLVALPTCQKP